MLGARMLIFTTELRKVDIKVDIDLVFSQVMCFLGIELVSYARLDA